MFNKKICVSGLIFLILLIFTSFIKNETRLLEKKIYNLNHKISKLRQAFETLFKCKAPLQDDTIRTYYVPKFWFWLDWLTLKGEINPTKLWSTWIKTGLKHE